MEQFACQPQRDVNGITASEHNSKTFVFRQEFEIPCKIIKYYYLQLISIFVFITFHIGYIFSLNFYILLLYFYINFI